MVKLDSCIENLQAAFLALLLIFAWQPAALAQSGSDADITVQVVYNGDVIHIDVVVPVRATPEEVWAVITDYDNAARFISNLKSSKVLSRNGPTWTVSQEMVARFGPFSTEINTVRELQLTPHELVRSRMLSGNMKRADAITRLVSDGPFTRIIMHSESIPDFWLPAFMSRGFIEDQTREQFVNLRKEVLRRSKPSSAKSAANS